VDQDSREETSSTLHRGTRACIKKKKKKQKKKKKEKKKKKKKNAWQEHV